MSAVSLSDQLVADIREEFPRFRLVQKSHSRLQRAIDFALKIVTLGRQRRYLLEYHTVIGDTLYLPAAWESASDAERCIVLRHERVHLRQRRRLGLPLLAFLYFLPILPLGLALGRARIEWEAYAETLRGTAELLGLDAARAPALKKKIVSRFTGPDYGWMWPFERQVGRWYDDVLKELERAGSGCALSPEPARDEVGERAT
jgi:hypothetical protein